MNQKLSFGEPFIESRYLEAEESFDVTNSAILVNLDKEQDIMINKEFALGALKALEVHDVTISVPGKALLIVGSQIIS